MWVRAKVTVDGASRVAGVNIDNPRGGGVPDTLDWPEAMELNHSVLIEWMGSRFEMYADGDQRHVGGVMHIPMMASPRLPPPPVTDDGTPMAAPPPPAAEAKKRKG